MREGEDFSTDSDQEKNEEVEVSPDSDPENNLHTLKKFQKRIAQIDEYFNELADVGLVVFGWSGLFFFLNLIFGWMGFFTALLWSGVYLVVGAIVGFFFGLILCALLPNWFVGAFGYVLPLSGIAKMLFPILDPTLNIAMHAGLSLLILILSKNAFNKKDREDRKLLVSFELQALLKDYDIETLDSDLCVMLDQAVYDRMDIYAQIYLGNDRDDILEGIGVLEDADEALCTLLKQAKTIMQFRGRVSRAEQEGSDTSSGDQLQIKLNEQMQQFIQTKTVLHELTMDILERDNEQIALGIQALQTKREEVALAEKMHTESR